MKIKTTMRNQNTLTEWLKLKRLISPNVDEHVENWTFHTSWWECKMVLCKRVLSSLKK